MDYSKTKTGDEIDTPVGLIKLRRPVFWNTRLDCWTAPGYRWIKSRSKFSGTALLHNFRRPVSDSEVAAHIARLAAADAACGVD